ncbi:hypothetical protein HDF11_005389 [Tunturiibacter psychrotolerans]
MQADRERLTKAAAHLRSTILMALHTAVPEQCREAS